MHSQPFRGRAVLTCPRDHRFVKSTRHIKLILTLALCLTRLQPCPFPYIWCAPHRRAVREELLKAKKAVGASMREGEKRLFDKV